MAASFGEQRADVGQDCRCICCTRIGNRRDRLSSNRDHSKKPAAGKKRGGGNQFARACNRDAVCREPGLSAGVFLCESTGAVCDLAAEFATRRTLFSNSKEERNGGNGGDELGASAYAAHCARTRLQQA